MCDVGISECDALIAQTGSVLITNRSAGGRALSVLPPHHVVLARREQLAADLPAAFELLKQKYAANYPSMISFITGPSRTGDYRTNFGFGRARAEEIDDFLFLITKYIKMKNYQFVTNLWNESDVAKLSGVDRLVYRSNKLGSDQRITNTGAATRRRKSPKPTRSPVNRLKCFGSKVPAAIYAPVCAKIFLRFTNPNCSACKNLMRRAATRV